MGLLTCDEDEQKLYITAIDRCSQIKRLLIVIHTFYDFPIICAVIELKYQQISWLEASCAKYDSVQYCVVRFIDCEHKKSMLVLL